MSHQNQNLVPNNSLLIQDRQQTNALYVKDMDSYSNQQQELNFADRSEYNKVQQQQQQLAGINSYTSNNSSSSSSSSSSNIQQQQADQIQGGLGIVRQMHDEAYIATRRYTMKIDGSPVAFASRQKLPVCPLGSTHGIQYRSDTIRGSTRRGNVKKGIVLSAKILHLTNDFCFPILVCCDQLRSNLYTNDPKQRGIVYIPAGKTVRNLDFYHPDTRIYSPIMQTYGDLKKSHLDADQLTLNGGKLYHAVEIGSPVANVIWRNSKNQDQNNGTYEIGPTNQFAVIENTATNKLFTPKAIFEKAVGALHNKVIKQMPYINMSGITFYIARANCGWLETGALAKFSSQIVTKVLRTSGGVYGEVQLKYRLAGHGSLKSY